jgi:hypothetical protein
MSDLACYRQVKPKLSSSWFWGHVQADQIPSSNAVTLHGEEGVEGRLPGAGARQ